MQQIFRIVIACFMIAVTACAPTKQVDSVHIVEAGIYRRDDVQERFDPTVVAQHSQKATLLFLKPTATVPLRRGVTFGIRFVVKPLEPVDKVKLRLITRFPSPGLRNPSTGQIAVTDERRYWVATGKPRAFWYTLDEEWEMVPGVWGFELWDGEHKLAEQRFKVEAGG